jgi:hypothetical protein
MKAHNGTHMFQISPMNGVAPSSLQEGDLNSDSVIDLCQLRHVKPPCLCTHCRLADSSPQDCSALQFHAVIKYVQSDFLALGDKLVHLQVLDTELTHLLSKVTQTIFLQQALRGYNTK